MRDTDVRAAGPGGGALGIAVLTLWALRHVPAGNERDAVQAEIGEMDGPGGAVPDELVGATASHPVS